MAGFRPNGMRRSEAFYLVPERNGLCPACGISEMTELVRRDLKGVGWECWTCRYVQPGCRECNQPVETPKQSRRHTRPWSGYCYKHSRQAKKKKETR